MEESFFRVQSPGVTFEDFKNEILIIDLKTGHYHSLRGSGVHVWRLLNSGQSVEASVAMMSKFYEKDASLLADDTNAFVLQLEQSGLISRVPGGEASAGTRLDGAPDDYSRPTIESYGDLQDLLLLDPIHEIAPEAGWPQRREEG